jgi:hypothetical protein
LKHARASGRRAQMRVDMKYIRYLIYLILMGILGSGLYGLGQIFHLWDNSNALISLIIGGSVSILVPIAISLSNDSGRKFKRNEQINNNYLVQKSWFEIDVVENVESVKNKIKEIMNRIVFELRCFNLNYENDDKLEYASEDLKNDLRPRQRNSSNTILVEFNLSGKTGNGLNIQVQICKENQFNGFSNSDNEELANIVLEKLKSVLSFAPRPPGVRRDGRKIFSIGPKTSA